MPGRTTTSTSPSSGPSDPGAAASPLRRWWLWAIIGALLVVVLPAASYFRDGFGIGAATRATDVSGQVNDFGTPYRAKTLFVLRAGAGPRDVASYANDPERVTTLEAIVPSRDGSRFWVIDHPAGPAGARVRLFDRAGVLKAAFRVPAGGTLFTPGAKDDLWVDFAGGSSRDEIVRRYTATGRLIRTYFLPEGVLARALCVTASGELFASTEQWLVDSERKEVAYDSVMIPVAVGPDLASPVNVKAGVVQASFFGADNRAYSLVATAPTGGTAWPAFSVTPFDLAGTRSRPATLAAGLRPYAADRLGHVYAEEISVSPENAGPSNGLGDMYGETRMLAVYEGTSTVAMLPLPREIYTTQWAPCAFPVADGRLFTATWGAGGVSLVEWTPSPGAARRIAQSPRRAGDLTVLTSQIPVTGDPYRAEDPAARDLFHLIYSGLTKRDGDGRAIPDLAGAVPTVANGGVSRDGRTITYRLRPGVRWHDGTAVTGADVVATWEVLCDPGRVPGPEPFPGFADIRDVRADGLTVTVTMRESSGAAEHLFPYVLQARLVRGAGSMANAAAWGAPMGSGPYRLERWERGRLWQLVAHDAGPAGAPRIRRVDVVASADDAYTRVVGAPGPVVAPSVDTSSARALTRDAAAEVTEAPSGMWRGALVRARGSESLVPAERSALRIAWPITFLFADLMSPGPSSGPALPGGPGDGSAPSADSTRAASAFLRQAGVKTPAPLTLMSGTRMGAKESSYEELQAIDGALKGAGFRVDDSWGEKRVYAGYWRGGRIAREAWSAFRGRFPAVADPVSDRLFDPADSPGPERPWGVAATLSDDRVLRDLYAQARREPDSAVRAGIAAQIRARAGALGLYVYERSDSRLAASRGVAGYAPAAYPAGDFWNVATWTLAAR